MTIRRILYVAAAFAAIAVLLRAPATAAAQDQTTADPPGRVACLNFLQGSVSFQPAGGGDNDWVAAELNRPLTTGDQLWSDTDGMVEMQVGSTDVRMDHNTGISYLNLSDSVIQLQVSAGSVIVHLADLDQNDGFELDAPNLAFTLLQPGTYEIDVDPDRNITTVTVMAGSGQVSGGGGTWNVSAGQQATFNGTDTLGYSAQDLRYVQQTSFEQWSAQRDQTEAQNATAQYVSPDMTGTEELGNYGNWTPEPQYGPVWFPANVDVGWVPYRDGHWVWIMPWGWTWVDANPWGFAPFHYGRWAVFGGRWGWLPGPYERGVRPVYAPALVAWVGGTPGFSFSIAIGGGGGIAWFPLGPSEVFVPTYRVSQAYVTRVNITNTRVSQNTVFDAYHNNSRNTTYVNQRVAGSVTVVSHDTFVSGAMVSRNVVNVRGQNWASAPVNRGGPNAQPTNQSRVGGSRPAPARPPERVMNRRPVTVRTPPGQQQGGGSNGNANGNANANGGRGGPGYRPPNQPENQPQPGNRGGYGPGGTTNPPAGNQPPADNTRDNGRNNNRNYEPGNTPNAPNQPNAAPNAPAANQPPAATPPPADNTRDNGRNNNRDNGGNNNHNNQPANPPAAAPHAPAPTPPAATPPPADNNRDNGRNNNRNYQPSNPPAAAPNQPAPNPPSAAPNSPPAANPSDGGNNRGNGRDHDRGNAPPAATPPKVDAPPPAPHPPAATPAPATPPPADNNRDNGRSNNRNTPPATPPAAAPTRPPSATTPPPTANGANTHNNDDHKKKPADQPPPDPDKKPPTT